MKRFFKIFCLLLAVSALFSNEIGAVEDTTPYDWYFSKNEEHLPPSLDRNLSFVKEDDHFHYLDTDPNGKVLYLTFDAGYENGNVAKVLDALKAHDAVGNFFVLINLIKREPALILRMEDEGHFVCNHTAKHPDMSAIHDERTFLKQLSDLESAYTELTGKEMRKYYRPPQGRFSRENLKYLHKAGYHTILWSFAYADWDNAGQPDPDKSVEQILLHTHPGMVILLHPTSKTNAEILDRLLTAWEEEGYRFGNLDELCR